MMEHKSLSGTGGTVHYWSGGSGGACILFTHGAAMDHALFDPQVEVFTPDYRVITWDVPAHGLSRPYSGFSLKAAAADLVRILDAEGVARAHMVGQSMGGYVSQIVEAVFPDRVSSIVAVDSSPVEQSFYSRIDRWLFSKTPAILALYPYGLLVSTIARSIAMTTASRCYALDTMRRMTKAEISSIMSAVYGGLMEYGHAPPASCPLLVIYGEADRTGKVRSYSDRWAAQRASKLMVVPDAAHNANYDNPRAFNAILREWLAGGESGRISYSH